MVATSECLRRHSTCSDSQEAEIPIEQVKQHSTDGNSAHGRCIGDVAGNGNIDNAHKGNRDIGQDTWNGKTKYGTVQSEKMKIND